MKKSLLFTSFHRIGVSLPKSLETPTYNVFIREQVNQGAYDMHVAEVLRQYGQVVAYAGFHTFCQLAEMVKENPTVLRLVACDCDQRNRFEMLERLGIDRAEIHWTRECGGVATMAKIVKYVKANDRLPDPW